MCRGAPSSAGGSALHFSLSPPLTCFFTFANETICMAEEEGGEGDGGRKTMRLEKEKDKKKSKLEMGERCDSEADRTPADKKKKHTVPGRYHHFQDGCRWRHPLWDQPRDPLLSLRSG